ncbi:hypothetical protein [Fusobacterium sp.]|uniref:hypothetical protein n=1 Tax=Fusobacterium sp. TaxID=68766 RepID=UPI002A82623C|nr:hypothetical protein [Fusobacterium sp.]
MFTILYVIVGGICILGLITEVSKLSLKVRVLFSIILIVFIFFILKEIIGASSIWDMFNLKFLEDLKKTKNL